MSVFVKILYKINGSRQTLEDKIICIQYFILSTNKAFGNKSIVLFMGSTLPTTRQSTQQSCDRHLLPGRFKRLQRVRLSKPHSSPNFFKLE
jgi:hypothetical protein